MIPKSCPINNNWSYRNYSNNRCSGGDITDDGGAPVTTRGVCWSKDQTPTINDSKTTSGAGTGSFSSNITNLEPNTTYYVRAYATNSEGTAYGTAISFKTLEEINLPTLTTAEVTEITQTTAVSGGDITDNGGAPVTTRGICWSTNQTPTINDSKTEDGTGKGSFSSNITNLEPNTTYYVRAYATNSEGTAYGSQVRFTTLNYIIHDNIIYGEVYNPITGRTWLDRNLGATQVATSSNDADAYGDLYQWGRGNDGHQLRTSDMTPIVSDTDNPGHSDFIQDFATPYDWRNPQNDNLWQGVSGVNNPCPEGYRIPTEAELDAEQLSWSPQNSVGAFASPLKLPLAGYRHNTLNRVMNTGSFGYWWSSTVDDYKSKVVSFSPRNNRILSINRADAYPVRCIKD